MEQEGGWEEERKTVRAMQTYPLEKWIVCSDLLVKTATTSWFGRGCQATKTLTLRSNGERLKEAEGKKKNKSLHLCLCKGGCEDEGKKKARR